MRRRSRPEPAPAASEPGGAAAPPGRRERRKRKTREALLEAALRLFGQRGLYETRVEDVTDKADLGKGAFYNYFGSKSALVAALVQAGVELLEQKYLGAPRPDSLDARVTAVVRAHDRFFREQPGYALVFHQARGLLEVDRSAATPLREVFERYVHLVASFLYPARSVTTPTLNAAVAVVGAIAGYRSFGLAAAVPTSPTTMATLLASGIAKVHPDAGS